MRDSIPLSVGIDPISTRGSDLFPLSEGTHVQPQSTEPDLTVLPDGGTEGRDDYRGTSHTTSPHHKRDSEPADPNWINHATRCETKIGPPSVSVDDIPDPLVVDDGDESRLPTVEEARETYLPIQRNAWNHGTFVSAYERQLNQTYPRIHEADRQLRQRYDGLTTGMITRRLSPIDDDDQWIPPLKIDDQLHDTRTWRSVRRCLSRQLAEYEFEYIAVTAPTESAATPHQHIYLWIDDPGDEISATDFGPVLDKHLKHCPNASEKHHQYELDGSDGAITVQHQPESVDYTAAEVRRFNEASDSTNGEGYLRKNTAGAKYLATQLAHLPLGDRYDASVDNPPQPLLEGAAIAWASPHNWLRTSTGVPTLNNGDGE